MCGITGLMFDVNEEHEQAPQFMEDMKDLFTESLLGIISRGREATGAALLKRDGSIIATKDNMSASKFTESEAYDTFLSYIDPDVIGIIGHTRQPTQGPASNNDNNHPHICGRTVGVHNGNIRNDTEKSVRFKLKMQGMCDSEIIFRLYDWAREKLEWTTDKALRLVHEQLKGNYACAMFSGWDPGKLILFKNWGAMNIARLQYKPITDQCIFMFNSEMDVITKAVKPHADIELKEWSNNQAIKDNLAMIVSPNTDFTKIELKETA